MRVLRKKPITNLKGLIIGNGITDFNVDAQAALPSTIFGMNIITKNIYQKYVDHKCHFSFRNVLDEVVKKECEEVRDVMTKLIGGLNINNLYDTPKKL